MSIRVCTEYLGLYRPSNIPTVEKYEFSGQGKLLKTIVDRNLADILSLYRKIIFKSISRQSTTILIAVVDQETCKGRKRKPMPPSQSSVRAAQTSPFIINKINS
jgi:hypothetical protein